VAAKALHADWTTSQPSPQRPVDVAQPRVARIRAIAAMAFISAGLKLIRRIADACQQMVDRKQSAPTAISTTRAPKFDIGREDR
jgi:hypothetical protein